MHRYEEDDLDAFGHVAMAILAVLGLLFVAMVVLALWVGWI